MRIFYLIIIYFLLLKSLYSQNTDMTGFSNTIKYNWLTPEDRYEFRNNLALRNSIIDDFEKEKIDVSRNMQLSLILPGTGHLHTGNYIRGILFLGGEIAIASTTIYFFNQGKSNHEKYRNATQIDDINRFYDATVTSYLQASIMTGVFIAVWVVNVFDTRRVTNEYNRRLWNDFLQREQERRVVVTTNGLVYRF